MKITISGTPGSGKSTLGKLLAEKLNLKYFSVGDMREKMALEKNMTLAELNKAGEKEDWTDKPFDDFIAKTGREKEDILVEARLAWHFIPDSIKIYVDVDEEVGAKRLFQRKSPDEKAATLEEAMRLIRERVASDKKRYEKYYDVDPYSKEHYDIIIDSTDLTPEEMVTQALKEINGKE